MMGGYVAIIGWILLSSVYVVLHTTRHFSFSFHTFCAISLEHEEMTTKLEEASWSNLKAGLVRGTRYSIL
jgi:hypothetical protein